MCEQENKETVVVPFNQIRLLILTMEAAKKNDLEKLKQIQQEAAILGIQM